MKINRPRRIVADDEINVAPEATELLFETTDVAELVAEITGEAVDVTATEDTVEFETESGDVYTVESEGDEEIVEARRLRPSARPVAAGRKPAGRRPVAASTRPAERKPAARRPVAASATTGAKRIKVRPQGATVLASRRRAAAASVRQSRPVRVK